MSTGPTDAGDGATERPRDGAGADRSARGAGAGPAGSPDVSTHPGGTPTGNPLDPLARPGTGGGDAPHTGHRAPPHDEAAPHDAVVTAQEQREQAAARPASGDAGDADGAPHGSGAPAQDAADPQGRAVPPAHPGAESADPDPGDTAGLEAGGGTAPGDTPPASGGTQTSLARNENLPGGRTRLIIPISIVVVLAIVFAAFFIGQFL